MNTQLLLAIAIVFVAMVVFSVHLISTTKRVGDLISDSRVPRRYLLLGVVVGLGILYVARR